MSIDTYFLTDDKIKISRQSVLDDSTQAPLDATQADVDVNLYNVTDGAAVTQITAISLTWSATHQLYTFDMSDFSASLSAEKHYAGAVTEGGAGNLRTFEIEFYVSPAGFSTQQKADINTEMVDVIFTDTIPELSVGTPAATPTMATAMMFQYMALRNESNSTSSLVQVKNNSGTVISQASVTESASQVTRAQFVSP